MHKERTMRILRITSSPIINVLIVFILVMVILAVYIPAYISHREDASQQCQSGPTRGFLHSSHGELVDTSGCQVHLTGVNWFGFETSAFAPHGLWVRNWQDMLNQIARTRLQHHSPAFLQSALRPCEQATGDQLSAEP